MEIRTRTETRTGIWTDDEGNSVGFNRIPYATSYYGYCVHPISGEKNYHKGIDFGLPTGPEIHAGFDGTLVATGYDVGGSAIMLP